MDLGKVSIIVPVYNVEEYLDDCIMSACKQKYENIEILLIDDGSTDSSGEICDKWKKKDSRIYVIHKENGGLSSARNEGLDYATGKFICFLDGDDTINSELLSVTIPLMKSGVDMVAFGYNLVFQNGNMEKHTHMEKSYYLKNENERKEFVVSEFLRYKIGWEAWSRIYLREQIEKYHLRFADNRVIFSEDVYFCLCYCLHARKIVSIEKCLYNYIQRTNSIMNENRYILNVGRMNELSKAISEFVDCWEDCVGIKEILPIIHYAVIYQAFGRALHNNVIKKNELYIRMRKDIDDFSYFKNNIDKLFRMENILQRYYTKSQIAEMYSIAKFWVRGSYLRMCLRNRWIYKSEKWLGKSSIRIPK